MEGIIISKTHREKLDLPRSRSEHKQSNHADARQPIPSSVKRLDLIA